MRINRNDLCWCNSGKKYKKCHMEFDERIENLAREGFEVPTRDIIKNATRVVATEIMAACQAIDFRKEDNMKLGTGTSEAYKVVRQAIDFIENDKDIQMYKYLDKATELIENGSLLEAVEEKVALEY